MSLFYGAGVLPERMSDTVLANPESADCMIPMGITSENVAKQYNISRDAQDTFAANSYAKAAEAQKLGKFREEIVPVKVSIFWSHRYTMLMPGTGEMDRPQDTGREGDHSGCR